MTANGLRMHYRAWSTSGQPIVLVHGLASNARFWDLVADILSDSFAVIALDQRGHGKSDKPDAGYDFAAVARDLDAVIKALGLVSPVVVGHSWGGNVALEYARTYSSQPTGLCLIDGGTIEISALPGMTLERAREEMLWANFDVLPDNTVRAKFERQNHIAVIDAFWENRPSDLYPHVRCPVLLMPARRGVDDPSDDRRRSLQESIALAGRLLPTSKTVWLEDTVHDAPLQRPELVASIIAEHIQGGFFDRLTTNGAINQPFALSLSKGNLHDRAPSCAKPLPGAFAPTVVFNLPFEG